MIKNGNSLMAHGHSIISPFLQVMCLISLKMRSNIFFGMSLADRPMLLLAVLLIVAGLQFITFGLLAELQVRTYHESQDKPTYLIRNIYESLE